MTTQAAGDVSRRPERETDAPFLFALFCAVQGTALAGLDPALRTLLLRQSFAGQRGSYRAAYPQARFDIVTSDGVEIGRLVFDDAGEAMTLVDIALLPDRQGRGVGTRLIGELIERARSSGKPVLLKVDPANLAAQRLYRRLGFAPVDRNETHVALRWG